MVDGFLIIINVYFDPADIEYCYLIVSDFND